VLRNADIVTLHMNLDESNRHFINKDRIAMMKTGAMLIQISMARRSHCAIKVAITRT